MGKIGHLTSKTKNEKDRQKLKSRNIWDGFGMVWGCFWDGLGLFPRRFRTDFEKSKLCEFRIEKVTLKWVQIQLEINHLHVTIISSIQLTCCCRAWKTKDIWKFKINKRSVEKRSAFGLQEPQATDDDDDGPDPDPDPAVVHHHHHDQKWSQNRLLISQNTNRWHASA